LLKYVIQSDTLLAQPTLIDGEAEGREVPGEKEPDYSDGVEDIIFLTNEPLEEEFPAPPRFRGGDF